MNISPNPATEAIPSEFLIKVTSDNIERKLVSLTSSIAVIGGLNNKIEIGEMVKFIFYVTLLEKNVPVYVNGNAIKRNGDEVTFEYDAPVKSWPKILEALSVTG